MKVKGQCVPCVRNSSYSFIPILLKLYRCCDHALKICIWFGYNPQINFCHFFHNLNLVTFSGILVNGYRVPCVRNSSYNLIPILLKLCRHCDHALKISIWLGYTPQINFFSLFYNLNLVIFWTFLHLESDLPVGGIVFHKHIF